jgi:hypothetical protein
MSNHYRGVIIEESLRDKGVLKKVKLLWTKVAVVTERHRTPWLSQWTLHTVTVPEDRAQEIAEEISASFDPEHGGAWYADFKDETHHYIIFPNKIFYIDRQSKEQYDEARQYGISLGIPNYQVNFHSEMKK